MLTTKGVQSLDECRESIKFHATNIATDISSTAVNSGRIASLRILLNLFEQYNNIMVHIEYCGEEGGNTVSKSRYKRLSVQKRNDV